MEPNDVAISSHVVVSSNHQCTTKDSVASLTSEAVNQSHMAQTKKMQHSTKQSLHSHLDILADLLSP